MQKALIYCRVSSDKQVKEGHGLDSQELACRKYAEGKGYKVVKVFLEEGVSGGALDRPAMKELISFFDKNIEEKFIVIFDDIKRWARDTEIHFALKRAITTLGHKVESPNFKFDDTPEGKFVETVFAATAELERNQNRRQVINRMKARLERGYWCFKSPPPGLIYKRNPTHGKILTHNEPLTTIYKQAIEDYEKGLLNSLEDVKFFIENKYLEYNISRKISLHGAKSILTSLLYTGWIEYKPWEIPLMKAQHNGFISMNTYKNVQQKILGKAKAPIRKDYNLDFPLRNFILCNACMKPMTASWHTGRKQRYPHYFCKQAGCRLRNKNVQKKTIEIDFEKLISATTPNSDVVIFIKAILLDIWTHRGELEDDSQHTSVKLINELKSQKKHLIQRASKADSEELIKEYEDEAKSVIKQIQQLEQKLPIKTYTNDNFGTACDIVIPKIEQPALMWQSTNYSDQRLLLEMYFEDKIPYDLEDGFGTARLACLPKLLCIKPKEKSRLVDISENISNQVIDYIFTWAKRISYIQQGVVWS